MFQNQNSGAGSHLIVPSDVIKEWQSILDGTAKIVNGLVTIVKFDPGLNYPVLLTSAWSIQYRRSLAFQATLESDQAFEYFISRKGYSSAAFCSTEVDEDNFLVLGLNWPDGKIFGEIGVFGTLEHPYPVICQLLLEQVRNLILQDLALLYQGSVELEYASQSPDQTNKPFRSLIEHASEHFLLHDHTGRFIDADIEACRSTGYSRGELLNMRTTDLVVGDSDVDWEQLKPGESTTGILHHQRKNKTVFLVEVCVSCYLFNDHKAFLRVVRDISSLFEREHGRESVQPVYVTPWQIGRGGGLGDLHHAITDSATDVIFLKDLSGHFLYLNQAGANLVGFTQTEVIGKTATDLFGGEIGKRVRYAELAVILYSEPVTTEETILLNGLPRLFHTMISLHRDESGKIIGLVGISRDVTEFRNVREDLQASEIRCHFAVEGVGDGIWDWDLRTGYVFYSKQWKAMLGYTDEEVGHSTNDWSDRVHPEDLAHYKQTIESHINDEASPFVLEHRMKAKDGSWHWILGRGKAVERTKDGKALHIIGMSTNITLRKIEEQQLRTQSERLTLATEVCGLGVWDYHIDTDELHCNSQWYRILGLDSSVPIKSIGDFKPYIYPDDVDRATDTRLGTLHELIANGGDYRNTFRIVRPDGEVRWVQSSGYLMEAYTGVPSRAIGVMVDITDRFHLEEELQEL